MNCWRNFLSSFRFLTCSQYRIVLFGHNFYRDFCLHVKWKQALSLVDLGLSISCHPYFMLFVTKYKICICDKIIITNNNIHEDVIWLFYISLSSHQSWKHKQKFQVYVIRRNEGAIGILGWLYFKLVFSFYKTFSFFSFEIFCFFLF